MRISLTVIALYFATMSEAQSRMCDYLPLTTGTAFALAAPFAST